MKVKRLYLALLFCCALFILESCKKVEDNANASSEKEFKFLTEQFADLKIVRYQVPGFDELSLKEKELCYYLYQAALSGRDIIWDQNYKHNLLIRKTLESIIENYKGDKAAAEWNQFMVYAKRVFFSNGIHHHYSTSKIMPEFSKEFFATLVKSIDPAKLPSDGFTPESLITTLTPILFDSSVDAKRVNLDSNVDLVKNSANNFYEGLTQKEVEDYYSKIIDKNNNTPISYGLNSKLIKENGKIVEKTWKVGGMYSGAIEKIVYWLEKAITVAETPQQQKALEILVDFYKTGDLKKFDDYNIAWVADTASRTDVVNGFIEVYGDALGYRASYESVVSIKDMEATKRIAAISKEAKWFEDNSPLMPNHKKPTVTGISAKVITVVVEAGDASPSTPIGINLPNANWIRRDHGSKSVNLGNIVYAYGQAAKGNGFMQEFVFDAKELEFEEKYGALGDNLHTDMHEVIGHASGQINPGVGQPAETLKNYASTLEEARADLVALYYMLDNKLVEIGVMPSLEVGKAQYNDYIRNGMMTQLVRLKPGDNIEESHMRNRQLIAQWVFEKGKAENVIEKVTKENKTYFVIRNYEKLRTLFGELLREVQRIKSEGDFKAGQSLVETYGVKVDPILHKEVLARYEKLKIAPYGGFLNPKLVAVEKDGKITDIKIEYPADFTEQMMFYGKEYAFLPVKN